MDDRDTQGKLHHIENITYRNHVIKIAHRGDDLKILIYAPGEMLATDIVNVPLSDYEGAIMLAKAKVDQSL
jgi:hypothetical protein